MSHRFERPETTRFAPFALLLPFALAACGGSAESAPGEGEAFSPSEVVGEAVQAPAPQAPAAAAPTPAAQPAAPSAPPRSSAAPASPPSTASAAAPTPEPAPTPAPEPEPLAIPTGTLIPAVIEVALSTRTHVTGDRFQARVVEEILAADGMVLVPAGARLEGRVAEARRAENSSEEALLLLTFDAVTIRGERFPIQAVVTEAEMVAVDDNSTGRTAAAVATGAAAGAVVGRILGRDNRSTVGAAAVGALAGAGVALTTRDGHAELREGARIVVRLEAPTLLAGG